ncbi:MAG: hypothetical protein ACW974_01475 [Candidatus Thorarchaeota archaeon]
MEEDMIEPYHVTGSIDLPFSSDTIVYWSATFNNGNLLSKLQTYSGSQCCHILTASRLSQLV